MVSSLWKACSEGDLQRVQELLVESSGVDIEVKDFTGITPLIEAVKNGHVEIVKFLIDRGADPANSSRDGPPESYTSNTSILELLQAARNKTFVGVPSQQPVYAHEGTDDPEKRFYAPFPPEPYVYYPTFHASLPPMTDDGAYYSSPLPPNGPVSPNGGIGHLPPPEVACMIPCRYFPACRYGSQCMFMHPQGPYYQGAMPPYPPYDSMGNPYAPHYYPPPPSFQQPPSAHSVQPVSPPPNHGMHVRSPSGMVSPPTPFSPNGTSLPPPATYGPPVYNLHTRVPVPMTIPQPNSQPPHPHPGPYSPPNLYETSAPLPHFVHSDGPYRPQGPPPNAQYLDLTSADATETVSAENNSGHPNSVNGIGHYRRESLRRPSFNPIPCLFFPSGRCKNGEECRFSHVLPDGATVPNQSTFRQSKTQNGPSRPPRGPHVNGHGNLAEKLNNLNLRDDQRLKNNTERSNRPTEGTLHKPKSQPNGKHHNLSGFNGHHNHIKKGQHTRQHPQRVPSADEFPVLAGSITPPKIVNGNGHIGLTAAQVLQAPPPMRKDLSKDVSKDSSTRNTTPEPAHGVPSRDIKMEVNGHGQEMTTPTPERIVPDKHPVMSFAAAAAASSTSASDTVKEVSVSA